MKLSSRISFTLLLSFTFFIFSSSIALADATATISNITPGTSLNVNQTINFSVKVSGFTNPSYTVSDPTSWTTLRASNINSSGNFGWTVKTEDLGSHTLTVTVTDSLGNKATANIVITVGTASASIQSLSPGDTVAPKQPVTFTVGTSGFTKPEYSISDSMINGSAVGISSTGLFSWIPTPSDTGIHIFTIRVSDSIGNSAIASQKITVAQASLSINLLKPGNTVAHGTPLSFTATAKGLSKPVFSVVDQFYGTTISSTTINSSGLFLWTPTENDRGTHNLNIIATDNFGNTAESKITILVTFPISSTTTKLAPSTTASAKNTMPGKYIFTKPLTIGSSGIEVSELQKKLASLGLYSGPITGTFGPLTRSAVIKFQTKNDLEKVGSIGPGTRNILNK